MKMNFSKTRKELSFLVLAGAMLMGVSAHATNLTDTTAIKALPTAVENGSCETPAYSADLSYNNTSWGDSITDYHTVDWFEGVSNNKFYWKTTASDDLMELWNGSKTDNNKNLAAADGNQYAELNADEEATLYQNIQTVPGAVYKWGLSHSGRNDHNTMAVVIGPAQTDDSIKNKAPEDSDPFMDMIHWLTKKVNHNENTVGCEGPHMVYSKELTTSTDESDSNFSLTKSDAYPYEWKCWIITDNAREWNEYGLNSTSATYDYTYEVPANQTATIFAFVSVHGDENSGNENVSNETVGNFLDGIKFEKAYPLRVSTTGGGEGRVAGKDYNGNTVNETVTVGNDYIGRFYEHDTPTVYATPKAGYKFLGAYYDGKLYPANDSSNTYDETTNTYSHEIVMNQPRFVELIFTAESTVIYEPNGGTYNDSTEETKILMDAIETPSYACTGDATPENDKEQFIGWYFARGGASDAIVKGDLITSDHTVKYDSKENLDPEDDMLVVNYINTRGQELEVEVPVADGVTFVAEWEYKQVVIPETKNIAGSYNPSNAGGEVTISVTDSDNYSDGNRTTGTEADGFSKYGWGRLADNVTMTATANEGYTFVGWYDSLTGDVITHTNIYTYNVAEPRTVYAFFEQTEIITNESNAYVSFVTDGTSTTDVEPFNEGSHVKYNDNTIASGGTGGVNVYGNTISTGFTVTVDGDSVSYDSCAWTITVPDADNVFVKAAASLTNAYGFTLGEDVLTDSAAVNSGTIYKATGGCELKGYDKLSTTITTSGSIVYGLVIDNLYAPDATAICEFVSACPDGYTDISNKFVHATSIEDYQNNKKNIYNID